MIQHRARRPAWRGLLILVSAVALAVACACAPRTREVMFWAFAPAEVVRPMLARFERSHPGVRVRFAQLGSEVQLLDAAEQGHPPDLAELMGRRLMPWALVSNRLVDWSAGTADLKPTLRGWPMCSLGDAVYGIPWRLDTRALFWNKRLFARAGLDTTRAPETWDALRTACAKIQRLAHDTHGFGVTRNQGALASVLLPFVWGNGGDVLSSDGTRAVFDSAATRAALAFYVSLRPVGIAAGQDTLEREFAAGRLACMVSGVALAELLAHGSHGLRYGVAAVPAPVAAAAHPTWAGGSVLASFTQSKHKPLALELARFLAQPENVLAVAAAAPRALPATAGADTMPYYRAHPVEQELVRQLANARFVPNHPNWITIEPVIEWEVGRALDGRKTAAQAATDIQTRLAQLVAGS